VVTTEDPWACTTGGTIRTRALVDAVAVAGARVTVVYPPAPEAEDASSGAPPRGAASRLVALGRLKREFLPLPTIVGARNRLMSASIDELSSGADLVIATTLSTAQYWQRLHAAKLWMEYSDLWSEFAARESRHRRSAHKLSAALQARHFGRLESKFNSAASIVTAAGHSDRDALVARGVPATWLPTPIMDIPDAHGAALGGTRTAGFIGNFEFHPNRDALELLVSNWGPELVRRGWKVAVAGRASDALSLPDWIVRLGSPASVREFYEQIDLALAPIRLGGGMKVKVVEALLHGRPVVASEFAMVGFPTDLRRLVSVVDLEQPEFPTPDGPMQTWPADHPALTPFTGATFRRTVADLLSGAADG
jgi:hypothetical protein